MSRQLVFVVFPDFQLLDVTGPIAAFEMANRAEPGAYELVLTSRTGGAVASSSGVTLLTLPFARVLDADTVIAAGGEGVIEATTCTEILAFIRDLGQKARRVASVCSGAYLLASAGLLSGRKATTHWRRSADFRRRFPDVDLDADRIHVNDEKLWTSAGISAGIDLSLALIADDLGEKVARQVARQLVVYYRRPGGQSQYSALLEMGMQDGRFASLLDYIRGNLDKALTVGDLAEQACMSPRHFARCFTAEIGTTPARAVERLRVEAASAALESGNGSVQLVARECGFTDVERMRRAFIRLKGIPPSAVKRHFR
ncbi:MAG: GlxA family transcriptional regulator [Azonexus sp.]|jgi:transcriptional regulator GlxA family with amidase domain|uniref:GlxA family transcriptional regulator n=1 Tax=Azonexus sp. TaxID=1872668 RepID=UPI00282EEC73|nr:GlxA family transcriptional regulator [Azonexus sp.]MDR0776927.1 GlxA family transcriptional regulator [Azonexus sp.]